jgi:SAM-dependent methyltransferase
MKALSRFLVGGGLLISCSAASAQPSDSLRADLSYLPPDAVLVVGFDPWPDGGDTGLFRDTLLGAVGFDGTQQNLDVLRGSRRVVLAASPAGDGRLAWLGAARKDAQVAPLLFGDPEQVARAREREGTARDVASAGGLAEPFLEASRSAHAWGVFTRAAMSCQGCRARCAHNPAETVAGSFSHSLREMEWWSLALGGTTSDRLQMRTRVRSVEDAAILADEQRAVLAGLRQEAHAEPDGIPLLLQQVSVRCTGSAIDLELPESAPLLRWMCRNGGCSAPLQNLMKWSVWAAEREATERPAEALRRLLVAPGERVADVGAGLGFFSARLARAVGDTGRVFAVEIDERLVAELRGRAAAAPYPQIEALLGTADDPHLAPRSLDAVLIVNAYHEMPKHQQMLEAIARALRPGGRLMLIEPFAPDKRAEPRDAQEREHLLAPELAEQDLREAGFVIIQCDESFVRSADVKRDEWLLLARRPER